MKNRLVNSFRVLKIIAETPTPIPLKELAGQCGLSVSSIGRIIADLSEVGLVKKFDYHTATATPGLIALGECALRHSPLAAKAEELLPELLHSFHVGGAFGTVACDELVVLYSSQEESGLRQPDYPPLWRSNIAIVVLAQSLSREDARRQIRKALAADADSAGGEAELRRFTACFDEVAEKGYLICREAGRRWSVTTPVKINGDVYGLTLFGPEGAGVNPERMLLECSRLCNRLREA